MNKEGYERIFYNALVQSGKNKTKVKFMLKELCRIRIDLIRKVIKELKKIIDKKGKML